MSYRYQNIQKEYMTKVSREVKEKDDITVIWVEECNKFVKGKNFNNTLVN